MMPRATIGVSISDTEIEPENVSFSATAERPVT